MTKFIVKYQRSDGLIKDTMITSETSQQARKEMKVNFQGIRVLQIKDIL